MVAQFFVIYNINNNMIHDTVKELYCDATIVYLFFDSTSPKKMEAEKWPKPAGSPLLDTHDVHIIHRHTH